MIERSDVTALMKSVSVVVRELVFGLTTRVDRIEEVIKEIPAGPAGQDGRDGINGIDGRDAEPVDIEKVISEIITKIPTPKDGIDGKDGTPGEKGTKGDPGERGERGDAGPAGPTGEKGDRGEPGESIRGERGEKGEPGESVIGPMGEKGEPGEPGPRGEVGERGLAGLSGERGEKGADGLRGEVGPIGESGPAGDPGRDALQIDILSAVNESKSYPRGTYAKYAGGIIRSFRTTDPITRGIEKAGWEVILDGLSSISVEQGADERSFVVKMSMTSGNLPIQTFSLPVLIYREIFKEATEYTRGDAVTYGGSVWHCQSVATKAKPGTSPSDWKLMVKKGRDGGDGLPGKPGERGPEGPRGRDLTQMNFDGAKH